MRLDKETRECTLGLRKWPTAIIVFLPSDGVNEDQRFTYYEAWPVSMTKGASTVRIQGANFTTRASFEIPDNTVGYYLQDGEVRSYPKSVTGDLKNDRSWHNPKATGQIFYGSGRCRTTPLNLISFDGKNGVPPFWQGDPLDGPDERSFGVESRCCGKGGIGRADATPKHEEQNGEFNAPSPEGLPEFPLGIGSNRSERPHRVGCDGRFSQGYSRRVVHATIYYRSRCMLRVMGFLIGMVATVGVGFVAAQESDTELPLPLVTLGVLPAQQAVPSAAEIDEDEILSLIDELDGLNTQEIGLLRQPAFGQIFLPVGYFDAFGVRKELYYKPFAPVARLIRIGPPAIPFLLEFLGDDTPTQFVVRPVLGNGGAPQGVSFDEVLHGNPLNWIEQSCGVTRNGYSPSTRDDGSSRHELECYRVKVGDVCFAVLGQIVGRSYDCLSYQHVKDGHIVVCSPVHRRNLRDRVIRIWSTNNPRQRLYESLVLDFATRPVQQGDDLNETSIASDLQVGAAVRLLYYYPVESSP